MKESGFTIVELLAVMVILVIIALIAVPALSASNKTADETYYRGLDNMIIIAAKDYFIDNRVLLPKEDGDSVSVEISSLVSLNYIEQPQSVAKNDCSGYVVVTKEEEYIYKSCLKCDDYVTSSECN